MVTDSLAVLLLSASLHTAGDHAALYQGRIEQGLNSAQWMSTPYYPDKEFRKGDVSYDGIIYKDVSLRYDAFHQNLVVVAPKRPFVIIPAQDKVDYFVLDDKKFVRMNDAYYCLEEEGEGYDVYRNYNMVRDIDVSYNGFQFHSLRLVEKYYIATSDSLLIPFKKRKNLDKSLAKLDKLRAKGIKIEPRNVAKEEYSPRELPSDIYNELDIRTELPSYMSFKEGGQPEYEPLEETYTVEADGFSDLDPLSESHTLREVEVIGFMQKLDVAQTGVEAFRPALLKNIPLAMGEADVMKMATMLPGVNTMGEMSSGLNVRGGASDQNLMLYNGNTIYNPMHMFGLFSTLNTDMVAETELYKGGIPSQYGGRLSSVMNVRGKYADKRSWHGSLTLGLVTSKGALEIPIVKDKVSLLVGGRTTYSDWMLKMIPEDSGYKNGKAGFWDLGATLSANLAQGHNLIVSGYYSHDRFSFTQYDHYAYANQNASIEWKGRFSEKSSNSLSFGYDHYDYLNDDKQSEFVANRLSYAINQFFVKDKFVYELTEQHKLSTGFDLLRYDINPGTYAPLGNSHISTSQLDHDKAIEGGVYIEDEYNPNDKLKITGGFRFSAFHNARENKEKAYYSPEVRLSASYLVGENSSIKVGANNMTQYIHKVSNTAIMSPTDTWTLSNSFIKPQKGWQFSTGYFNQSEDGTYEFSVEAYYKTMNNYLTYGSGAQLIMNPNLEDDVIATQGRSYGIELQVRKLLGKFTGWINYTFSRSKLRQKTGEEGTILLNRGNWFPAECDMPHALKVVTNYKFTRRFSLSLNADYATGRPTTLPAGQFYDSGHEGYIPYYTERNGYRIPDYFRMDGSFNIEPTHHLTAIAHHMFSIGVYNILGRRNVYSVYYEYYKGKPQGYSLSVFGAPIPYFSYSLKF